MDRWGEAIRADHGPDGWSLGMKKWPTAECWALVSLYMISNTILGIHRPDDARMPTAFYKVYLCVLNTQVFAFPYVRRWWWWWWWWWWSDHFPVHPLEPSVRWSLWKWKTSLLANRRKSVLSFIPEETYPCLVQDGVGSSLCPSSLPSSLPSSSIPTCFISAHMILPWVMAGKDKLSEPAENFHWIYVCHSCPDSREINQWFHSHKVLDDRLQVSPGSGNGCCQQFIRWCFATSYWS